MLIYSSEVVAKQRGAVRRCANHVNEDKQSGNFDEIIMVM